MAPRTNDLQTKLATERHEVFKDRARGMLRGEDGPWYRRSIAIVDRFRRIATSST